MPEDTGQPPVEVPIEPPVAQQTDVLPDTHEPADKVNETEAKVTELETKLATLAKEKEELAARLKENQDYISRTRNMAKEIPIQMPVRTIEDYLAELDKIVDTDFENDPKQGLKKAVRKIVTDVASDRDLQQQEYEKRIAAAEENAFRRMLKLDPEKAQRVADIEKLDAERPDLKELTFDQKMEWVNMRNLIESRKSNHNAINRERELASEVGGGMRGKSDKLPAWANDPEVQAKSGGQFRSKKEMIDWANADYNKAMELIKQRRGA